MIYLDACRGLNHIGRLGENEHRTIRFWESAEVLAMYPEASVTVLHKRPGDAAAYPVAPGYVEIQDGIVCWTIQSGDLAKVGRGKAELVFTNGGVIAKTMIYDTMIDQALDGAGDPPEPWESWIEEVVEAGEHAPIIRNGTWYAWDISEGDYVNTGVNAGISGVTLNADYTLTISFTDGTSATVGPIRGAQGEQGEPGEDYVITQADYAAIAAIVMQDAGFQQKVDAAEAAADESRGWADGKHLDGTINPQHSENNAEHYAGQASQSATDANAAKVAIQNMTVSATELQPGDTPTATKTVDPETGEVNIDYGIPPGANGTNGNDGVTFTPAVSAAGVISWTNDGERQNPSPVDIPALVEGVFVETVTGTTPFITGVDNHRYICGEVSTITIAAPASGTIEVIFESGSTAAILTASGVMWPDWFDDSSLETDRIYDVMITDGLYGSVMSWASA